jgi:hypothetical protein
MKLSEVKNILATVETVSFKLEDGTAVPEHFHVTEIGVVSKHFIDCGGVVRKENKANFQLWDANDFEHRLKPGKLLNIIGLSEKVLGLENLEIEVEYQSNTIGKYALDFDGKDFVLVNMQTACLAKEACGVPNLVQLPTANACTPGGGCC